jgi:PIN domain nuclease of toxin-antitoxin system
VKLLLDTQTFLWFIDGSRQLSRRAKAALENEDNTTYFSAASYWEICIKVSLKKLVLSKGWQEVIFQQLLANDFKWLPIERAHCDGIVSLPWHHRDPFDRLLISQALSNQLVFVSGDRSISQYSVPNLW